MPQCVHVLKRISTSWFSLPLGPFLQPTYKGQEVLSGPTYAFFIEHPSGQRVLFDLGIRKDWENYPPRLVNHFKDKGWDVGAKKNTSEILQENGVDVEAGAIDAVIWSHHHWDHVGDMTKFPGSTKLVVGPGFKEAFIPGYPINKESHMLQADFEGREVREVDIVGEGQGLKIGRFNAYDYFGDGSFFLLDTPGHSVGHICGLGRTTRDSFIFMGGDASHHGGEFRPSEYLPLPKEVTPSPMKKLPTCPGHLLQEVHREKSASTPYYLVTELLAHDLEVCNWTVAGLQEFDAADNVLLLIAHDDSVRDVFDFYPMSANDWHDRGLGKKARWMFLGDFEEAIEDAQNGKE